MPSPRLLSALAWGNVVLHGAGLALAWSGMRPGSVVAPLADRMAYLAARPAGWSWGWGVFMLCTLLLVAYMAALRARIPGQPVAALLAVIFTAAGMAVDLFCDVLQMQALPLAAQAGPADPGLFLVLERTAFTGGATVANGLYTTGVLLMTLCLRGLAGAPARFAGWATAVAGYAMVLAGLLPSPELLLLTTGPTLGFYSLWTVLVARDLAA